MPSVQKIYISEQLHFNLRLFLDRNLNNNQLVDLPSGVFGKNTDLGRP